MNIKKIMQIYLCGLTLCIIFRTLQLRLTVEYANGFYLPKYELAGKLLFAMIFVFCVVLAFFCFKSKLKLRVSPKFSAGWAALSAVLGVALICEAFGEKFVETVMPEMMLITKTVTVLCAVYFIALALCGVMHKQVPALFHIVPCVYVMVRTVFTFVSVSSLALISDNILLVAAYCIMMIFFIAYGKLYNSVSDKNADFKLLGLGLSGSVLCISQSISYFIINALPGEAYHHVDAFAMVTLLLIGAFVGVFVWQSVSKE